MLSNPVLEAKINEIKNLTNIVEVISDYLSLRKVGRNYVGLCPFHSENKASFTVSPEKQIYHCFGCGAGGNVFNFLMRYHNLSFPEVIKELARKHGVILPFRKKTVYEQQQDELRSRILNINRLAAEYYQETLDVDPRGTKARVYLNNRGISREAISEHRLGYARESWNDLRNFFQKKGISLDLVERAGLLISKEAGGYYDRFRDRIIFPIIDVYGEVVGFGGRVLDDSVPKYINSPETPIYHKGHSLYGLNVAKDFIRKEGCFLVVEGYFDLLALHTQGIKNVVSTLGTALTRDHIRRLKGYTSQGVIVFDSDQAGLNAALRSLSLFLEENVTAKILVLPQGLDPDNYIFQFGNESFKKVLKNASPLFEFFLDRVLKRFGVSVEGKIGMLKELVPVLANIRNPLEQSVYVKKVAETLDVEEGIVYKAVKGFHNGKSPEIRMGEVTITSPDQKIIQFLINHPQYFPIFVKENIIDDLDDKDLVQIGTSMKDLFHKSGHIDIGLLVQKLEDTRLRSMVTEWALRDTGGNEGDIEQVVKDMVNFIKTRRKRREAKDILAKIKESKDSKLLNELLLKKRELTTTKR